MNYKKLKRVSIKGHPLLNEAWIQDRIAEDPAILGLGDLILKDKERRQPRAGRLDLLLQDPDSTRRYEVEVQLGSTDESHIIRAIEYWDIERKRYPQYEHTAVLVAEDITSRFFSVIALFNGFIPFIAIQMQAVEVGDDIALICTKVLDQMLPGVEEDDDDDQEVTDRDFWIQRSSQESLAIVDQLLTLAQQYDSSLELKYNKFYIGLAKNGIANNFAIFRPKKSFVRFEPRLHRSDELREQIEASGLDLMDYSEGWKRYRIRLTKRDVEENQQILSHLLGEAYKEFGK